MDIEEIRRENCRALAAKMGGPAAFARELGYSLAYVSQIIGHGKMPRPRGIGKRAARTIEKKAKVEKGWLDVPRGYAANALAIEGAAHPEVKGVELPWDAIAVAQAWLVLPENERVKFRRDLEGVATKYRDRSIELPNWRPRPPPKAPKGPH